ncbi:uncharacterized protein PV06_09554 [Exophiala oligosperma]|uniref:Nitrogen regulatory protein areA GATA-like domain-containing protein n=1 Tax=Exophiala oligosperma TaxID=215243 RepID=A0A0D2D855_9EURO|nr:uncharacterized protein PV06_09554 [Exophiala oligosperma]KIW38600.1 hypothetical protein PV06_09554 [Exophiala oligosperma]
MTAILPRGLINTIPAVEQDAFGAVDSVADNADALHHFWRYFAVQSDLSGDPTCTRSRNLFWRVWSDPELAHNMTVPRLMRLWRRCDEQFDLSPIGHINVSSRVQSQATSIPMQESKSCTVGSSESISPRSHPTDPHYLEGFPPLCQEPPGRRLVYDASNELIHVPEQRTTWTTASASNTASASSSRPTLSRTTSGSRSRIPIVATAGRTRTRPQLGRRKSSSSRAISTVPNAPKSPRIPTEPSGRLSAPASNSHAAGRANTRGPPPGLPNPPVLRNSANFLMSSPSSWQSVNSGTPTPPMGATAPATTAADLVERDFRGKFVEAQKKLNSFTNLPVLMRMPKNKSVVRFADEDPLEEEKGKNKAILSEAPEVHKGPSSLRLSMPASPSVSDDEYSSDDAVELPRSKSQLSLLIRHKRAQTGSQDLGPGIDLVEASVKPKGKDKGKATEEELLIMARRDGVTKAGGVQLPASHRISGEDPGYFSPSSPEPLF